jgi:hypothetical protein
MSRREEEPRPSSEKKHNKRRRTERALNALWRKANSLGSRGVLVGWVDEEGLTYFILREKTQQKKEN